MHEKQDVEPASPARNAKHIPMKRWRINTRLVCHVCGRFPLTLDNHLRLRNFGTTTASADIHFPSQVYKYVRERFGYGRVWKALEWGHSLKVKKVKKTKQ